MTSIYNSIAQRTKGDIYIGIVGPVRTGKSTFIKKFMDNLVIPNIDDESEKKRAVDELPQSASGKTIMTTEPKFIPEKSIELLYLNFSCPYPKARYARHRLTHRFFLDIYRSLLKDGAEIHQKTDNMHFFEFSIEEYSAANYKIRNVSLDLHNSDFEGNIVTEYEKRFSDLGQPIYRLEATLK